jgi:hypothetical protein
MNLEGSVGPPHWPMILFGEFKKNSHEGGGQRVMPPMSLLYGQMIALW